MDLIFHADDFGITPEQSEHILRCSDICGGTGALNSLSVLVNSPHFPTCADLLDEHLDSLRVGLHVNIVEGRCCADPATIPLLVDGNGVFKHSFAELLFAPRGEMRCAYRSQLAAEIGRGAGKVDQLLVGQAETASDHRRHVGDALRVVSRCADKFALDAIECERECEKQTGHANFHQTTLWCEISFTR